MLEPAFRSPYVNVNRWFLTCVNQPQFKAVLGEVEICTKMASFDGKQINGLVQSGSAIFCCSILTAKKYNQLFPSKKEKSSKKKEEKPPAEKKAPKTEKAKPDKKQQEQQEEEDPAVKEPKFKDPYIDLPKR